MTCCGGEMCVGNTGKQNTCQTSWHFCSGNTNLGWQDEMNPDMRPPPRRPPSHPPPAGLSTGGTTWLTVLSLSFSLSPPLPLPLSDSLTASSGYQLQDTTIPGPLSAPTSYSSSRWPDGILGKYTAAFSVWNTVKGDQKWKLKKNKKKLPCIQSLFVNHCSLHMRERRNTPHT